MSDVLEYLFLRRTRHDDLPSGGRFSFEKRSAWLTIAHRPYRILERVRLIQPFDPP